jgi:predicted adenine nucleotide alpha hydrolase (AANH) superfamily ATPase
MLNVTFKWRQWYDILSGGKMCENIHIYNLNWYKEKIIIYYYNPNTKTAATTKQ